MGMRGWEARVRVEEVAQSHGAGTGVRGVVKIGIFRETFFDQLAWELKKKGGIV